MDWQKVAAVALVGSGGGSAGVPGAPPAPATARWSPDGELAPKEAFEAGMPHSTQRTVRKQARSSLPPCCPLPRTNRSLPLAGKLVALTQPLPAAVAAPAAGGASPAQYAALQLLAVEQEVVLAVGPGAAAAPAGAASSSSATSPSPAATAPPVPLHWAVATLPDWAQGADAGASAPHALSNVLDAGGRSSLGLLTSLLQHPEPLPPFVADDDGSGGSGDADGGAPLLDAAVSFSSWDAERAVERATSPTGGSGSSSGSAGVWGYSSEPGDLLRAPCLTLPLLAAALPAPAGDGSSKQQLLQLLAHGTLPLVRRPVPPPAIPFGGAPPVPLALSTAPHGGSLVSAALVNGGTQFRALQVALTATPAVPRAGPALPHYAALAGVADAAARHAARSVAFARVEWAAAVGGVTKLLTLLESQLPRFSKTDRSTAAARAFYPHSPTPLAVAELWRVLTVGASSGALQHWVETAAGGEPGFAKAWKAVDAACSTLEGLLVTHVARSGEAALLALDQLRRAAAADAAAGDGYGFAALGLSAPALDAAAAALTALLARTEAARCCVAQARSVYGAIFVWLRLLVRQVAAAAAAGEAGTAALNASIGSSGGAPTEAAKRTTTHAPRPQASELALVRAALTPAAQPVITAAAAAAAAPVKAAASSDPLGLGFGSGSGLDDSGSLGGAGTGAASSDPLGLGFSGGLDDGDDGGNADPLGLGFGAAAPSKTPAAVPQHDPLLPFSLTALLAPTDADVRALRLAAAAPMATYAASQAPPPTQGADGAAPPLSACAQTVCAHVRAIVATAAGSLSTGAGAADTVLVALPLEADPDDEGAGGGGFNPLAFAMGAGAGAGGASAAAPLAESDHLACRVLARAVTAFYDDGPGWAWPAPTDGSDGGGDVPQDPAPGAFGSHVTLVPLSSELTPAAASLPAAAVLVLRVARRGYPDEPPPPAGEDAVDVTACVVSLQSPTARLVGGTFYGPAPGAVPAAAAAAAAAGGAFALAPTVASTDGRQVTVVTADFSAGADAPATLAVGQLAHRALPFVAVPAPVLAAAASDAAFLLDHLTAAGAVAAWADAVQRYRTGLAPVPLPSSSTAGATDADGVSLRRYAAACEAVAVDVSGPRGCAVVAVSPPAGSGGRRLLVLDMEEDEEDAADSGGGEREEGDAAMGEE
jgi:hypothetical protein